MNRLLRIASGMAPEFSITFPPTNAVAKRSLYARSIVRLLRGCAAKNQRLLSTKKGQRSLTSAFLGLLNDMNNILNGLSASKTLEDRQKEALNLMVEIILPTQTQSEETSK